MNKKKKNYPKKVTVNLIQKERSSKKFLRGFCLFLILAVAVAAFAKFAVIDRMKAAENAEREALQKEAQLAELEGQNTRFGEVLLEYQRRVSGAEASEQTAAADCMEVLSLIESKLMTSGRVAAASYAGELLYVQLLDVDLNRISVILADLYTSPLVTSVDVSTADANAINPASASMTITLDSKGGEE